MGAERRKIKVRGGNATHANSADVLYEGPRKRHGQGRQQKQWQERRQRCYDASFLPDASRHGVRPCHALTRLHRERQGICWWERREEQRSSEEAVAQTRREA